MILIEPVIMNPIGHLDRLHQGRVSPSRGSSLDTSTQLPVPVQDEFVGADPQDASISAPASPSAAAGLPAKSAVRASPASIRLATLDEQTPPAQPVVAKTLEEQLAELSGVDRVARELQQEVPDREIRVDTLDTARFPGRVASVAEISDIHAQLRGRGDLLLDYHNDGCYARAHLVCAHLKESGINCGKIFINGSFKKPLTPPKGASYEGAWLYHVAACTWAYDPHQHKEVLVVVEMMRGAPESLAQWASIEGAENAEAHLDLTPVEHYATRSENSRAGPIDFQKGVENAKKVLHDLHQALQD